MDIKEKDIKSTQRIGTCKLGDVFESVANGGLILVEVRKSDGKTEIIGTGPHRSIARYIAECQEPSLEFTELSKSQNRVVEANEHLLPRYVELTKQFRRVQGV